MPESLPYLQSKDNPLLKRIARLQENARARQEEGTTVLEGWHLIRACAEAPRFGAASIERLVLCDEIADMAETRDVLSTYPEIPVQRASSAAMSRIGPTSGPNAVAAIIRTAPGPSSPRSVADAFELWLDDVQDPGNVGTLIRTAAAAGATRVCLGAGCAEAWSPKVLRAGMGGHFGLQIDTGVDLESQLRQATLKVVALAADGETDLFGMSLVGPVAILLGNEGAGLRAPLVRDAHVRARIPMPGTVESLNVAAAGAVVCFERVRQKGNRRG
jgi:TrmH family RNA methyltransferase